MRTPQPAGTLQQAMQPDSRTLSGDIEAVRLEIITQGSTWVLEMQLGG
jgi:hypothetical protein